MSSNVQFDPGPANLAHVDKNGEDWTLVLVKQFRHSPEKVWQALTDPAELSQWAPFDADASLAVEGAKVNLTTVGAPQLHVTETTVTKAQAPNLLEFNWTGDMRWQLEPHEGGTKLTLWAHIDKRYIAMGAAGWQVCFGVLDHLLSGEPVGRTVGPNAMHIESWQKLHKAYAEQFHVEMPKW